MAQAPTGTLTPRPTRIPGIFEVPSRTQAGAVYTTDVRDATHPACTCPAGKNNFENCRHVATCWHVRVCLAAQTELDRARTRALIVRPHGMAALYDVFGPA